MKKIITSIFIVAFLFMEIQPLFANQKDDTNFQKVVESFFDELWKFYPTAGTLAGYEKYNGKLENMSSKAIGQRHDTIDGLSEQFVAKIDVTSLSPDMQIEHEMMRDALDLELLKHESLLPWEYNPIFYNAIISNCVRSLLAGDAPVQNSVAKNAADRLKALPKLLKQAKENLKTPPEIYTKAAIEQFGYILDYYQNELPQQIEKAPAKEKTKLQSNRSKAIPALQEYKAFLENELLPRSTGSFRLAEAHRKMVRAKYQNEIPLNDLIAQAQADVKNIRREMLLVCMPFYKIMDPKIDLANPPANLSEEQIINMTVSHVFDRLKLEHPSKEEFLENVKTTVQNVKDFLLEKQLVDLPESEIDIEIMPAEYSIFRWTRLVKPKLYESAGSYAFQIALFPEDMDSEKLEAFLGEYDTEFLPFWAVKHIYPGPFVPYVQASQYPSLVRKFYANQPLIHGWALLLEEKLVMNGYRNYDLRLRLNQLKLQLKGAIDFILDFNIHESGMNKEDAIAYMVRMGFQSEVEAERTWKHILLNPVDVTYSYVGYQEYLDLEKKLKEKRGDAFNQKEFMSEVFQYGALPIRHLKTKILE